MEMFESMRKNPEISVLIYLKYIKKLHCLLYIVLVVSKQLLCTYVISCGKTRQLCQYNIYLPQSLLHVLTPYSDRIFLDNVSCQSFKEKVLRLFLCSYFVSFFCWAIVTLRETLNKNLCASSFFLKY